MTKQKWSKNMVLLTASIVTGLAIVGQTNASAAYSIKNYFTPFGISKATVDKPTYHLNFSQKEWKTPVKKGMQDWNQHFNKSHVPYHFNYTNSQNKNAQFTIGLLKLPKLKYNKKGKPVPVKTVVPLMSWYNGVMQSEYNDKVENDLLGVTFPSQYKGDPNIYATHIFLNKTNLTEKNSVVKFNNNRQVTITHELGHTLGFDHDDKLPSIMSWAGSAHSQKRNGTVDNPYFRYKYRGKFYAKPGHKVRGYANYISKYDMRAVQLRYKNKAGKSSVDLHDKLHPDKRKCETYDLLASPSTPNLSGNILIPDYTHELSNKNLKKDAQYIISGKVNRSKATTQNDIPVTDQTIALDKVYKGKLGVSEITVRQLGNSKSISSETRVLYPSQKVILYLDKCEHGRYTLLNDGASIFIRNQKHGKTFFTRGNNSSQYSLSQIIK